MSEKPTKPGAIADAKALSGSDEAQAHVRRWWRLVPRTLTHPTEVFVALRDDDEVDVDARSEPILAIVIIAGMAGILLTPAWATLIDEESLDWVVIAVITFIGGLFYGAAGYFLLGLVVWLGARAVGLDAPSRTARQVVGFAALPFALSFLVTVPAVLVAFGYDWFRTGGSDDGTRPCRRPHDRARIRALVARAAGARPADDIRAAVARRRRRPRAGRGDHRGVRRAAVI